METIYNSNNVVLWDTEEHKEMTQKLGNDLNPYLDVKIVTKLQFSNALFYKPLLSIPGITVNTF